MEIYILIWTLTTESLDRGTRSAAIVTHSQEFSSKTNCEFAMQQLVNMIDKGTLFIGCYPK